MSTDELLVLDKPNQISMFRLLSLKGMLKLEIIGMHRSHPPSAYTIIKKEFGFKGNKQRVLEQFEEYIFKLKQQELDLGH
jgi:hypothetical protein